MSFSDLEEDPAPRPEVLVVSDDDGGMQSVMPITIAESPKKRQRTFNQVTKPFAGGMCCSACGKTKQSCDFLSFDHQCLRH